MSKTISYRGCPIVLQGPYCPLCGCEMTRTADGTLDCPLCRAKEEASLLREAARGAISSLNSQRKYIMDDTQAIGHAEDAILKLSKALKGDTA